MIKILLLILILSSSCDDPAINGCTSPSACNFNPNATKSNGSCIQPEGCNDWCPDESGEPAELDCAGECGGNTQYDNCGICGGDNSTCIDCDGTPNGNLIVDCNGECGGTAIIDDCGLCTGGNTELAINYLKDCEDVCGGAAIVDDCGICVGGNTGYTANFLKDECGVCNGDGYTESCINGSCEQMDCAGVCNNNGGPTSYSTANECNLTCEDCGWKPIPGCDNCEELGECESYGATLDTCEICSNGRTGHIADSDKDCSGVCFGSAVEDCSGECNGDAVTDQCGICDGDNSSCIGCDGVINSGYSLCTDQSACNAGECLSNGNEGCIYATENFNCEGDCIAQGDNLDENGLDCLGTCGGNAQYDDCGLCNGDGYELLCIGTDNCTNMDCTGTCIGEVGFGITLDCAGVCQGSASYGCDGQCCGGSTGDVCAVEDECNTCDTDSSNDCIQDCNGDWGGLAEIDNCGTCAGGNTGITPNQGTTPDGLYSCSDMTLLVENGVCEDTDNDGADSDDCIANTCPKILWEGTDLKGFDFSYCAIPQSVIPDYVPNFEITTLYLNDQGISDFSSIINMTTLEDVNLEYNQISSLPSNFCNLVENPSTVKLTGNILDCSEIPICNSGTVICD